MLFMNANNKIRKGSPTTYGEWATKKGFIWADYRDWETDRKSTRLNSSHSAKSRMPSSA